VTTWPQLGPKSAVTAIAGGGSGGTGHSVKA
jgi:hypothetical protein